ncbi:hypothetical protein COX09_04465 [Candidatus Beckwithbacteria bacterium CG23_combo_of_CG06-09_8_20_14_all_47_9]|uniref:YrhK domain-containing protein n=1 Tax=Candidatus Beckwithbacteria bacterium CG23_combo_of_CG06-09_8_20_14_all_47_9 TaxID=1974498 RepID=A0A2H0B2M7_9BACT|nr:MAG: hypothetical protein COX09_04465 [Candidatus Beckwithbacteria bacterium CG23_combo_of_CG06-09_8_20_14_all_47_9]
MVRRKRLSKSILIQAAEIFGNVSVAWFSAGVIIPILGAISDPVEFTLRLLQSLGMAGFFFWSSLELAKRGRK